MFIAMLLFDNADVTDLIFSFVPASSVCDAVRVYLISLYWLPSISNVAL